MTEKNRETKNYLNMHKRLETAILDYSMIKDGDHVLAAVSGGKDSTVMLKLLSRKKVNFKSDFKLSACFLKQGFNNDEKIISYLKSFCADIDVVFHVINSDMKDFPEKGNESKPCYVCSRNRRLNLFKFAKTIGAKTIAFGHHRDDLIETLLMNMICSGQIGTMSPNTPFFKGEFNVIRPMVYIHEHQIRKEVDDGGIKSFLSGCPYEGNSERDKIRKLIKEIYRYRKGAKRSLFRSMFNYDPDYLLKTPSKESVVK